MARMFLVALLATTVTANCLLKQSGRNTNLCLIEENLADENFLRELCKGDNGALTIIAEYRSEFETSRKFADYCNVGAVGRLSWIQNKNVLERLLNSKNVDVDLPRVARSIDTNNQSVISTDYTADDIQVLIEKLPIRYEMRNMERTKWKNVTEIQQVTISKEHLKNTGSKSKLIAKEVQYTSNHVVEYVFPATMAHTREVRIFKNDGTINRVNTFAQPIASPEYKTFFIERRVGPESVLNTKVIGTLAKTLYDLEGELTKVYDDDERETSQLKIQVIETDLIDVHAEDYVTGKSDGRGIFATATREEQGSSAFQIWVIIAYCIFFGVIAIVAIDVTIKLVRGKRGKPRKAGPGLLHN